MTTPTSTEFLILTTEPTHVPCAICGGTTPIGDTYEAILSDDEPGMVCGSCWDYETGGEPRPEVVR